MSEPSNHAADLQSQRFAELMKQVGHLLVRFGEVLGRARELDVGHSLLESLQDKLAVTRRKWEEQRFQIAVLALVKSGKSTLINSWLGDEYLPAANTPETTRIVRIRHAQVPQGMLREGSKELARGADATKDYLRSLNRQGRERDELPREDELVLDVPLVALEGRSLGTQKFEILDTPGPNEAGTSALRHKVERVLGDADVIVYVLDYTKLKTEEELKLFELLQDMRPELLQRCSERLFFVVNKIDLQNRNGLSLKATATYVTELLQKQLPSVTITAERIILVASELGLLARIVERRTPSEKAQADFIEKVWGISRDEVPLEECRQHAPTLLQRSRVPQLEEQVLSFIYQHRGRLMLQGLLDDLQRSLSLLGNHLRTSAGALKKDHDELVQRKSSLEQDLAKVMVGLQDITRATKQFETDTEKWVRTRFDRFKQKVQLVIVAAFDRRERKDKLPQRILRRLERVWNLLSGHVPDEASARQRISEVNDQLVSLVEQEFATFREALEGEAHEKQRELFEQLQKLMSPLARHIEREVGRALNIQLSAVPVRLPAPSLDTFQQEMQLRIDSLVRRTQQSHQHVRQEQYMVKKGGWCSKDVYGVRDIVTISTSTAHEVAVTEMQRLWSEQLDALTDTSVRTARTLVSEMTAQSLKEARSELDAYAASFLQTIEREIRESEAGKVQREARLRAVEERLGEVEELRTWVSGCARELGGDSQDRSPGEKPRDVFICYDRREVVAVTRVIGELERRGVSVWVDFRDLRPGFSWQSELEKQIQVCSAVAVFIGKTGLSYWQEQEQQAFFRRAQKRKCPIIPVVLQDCEGEPELPAFLDAMHRVDFRHSVPDAIEQLVYGIRGTRPSTG